MGAATSATRDNNRDPPQGEQIIRPYGLAPDSKWIRLNSPYEHLYGGIVSLILENKYTDLVIICGSDRYPVHRAIVCPRSKFFDDYCTPHEGEQDYASPTKPTKIWVDPSDCESHILAGVLTFLYTLDYSADGHQRVVFGLPQEVFDDGRVQDEATNGTWENGIDDDESSATTSIDETPSSGCSSDTLRSPTDPGDHRNELVFHVQMCAAGHRFGIGSLCDVANEKLAKRLASPHWETEMIGCIREVYRHGSGGHLGQLRDVVVKSARSRFRTLKMRQEWEGLVLEFPQFAAEMLRRM